MIELGKFLAALLIAFFGPGIIIIQALKIEILGWRKVVLATTIGYLGFSLLSYFLYLTDLRILLYPILIITTILALKSKLEVRVRGEVWLILVLLVVSFLFSLSMIRSGWMMEQGLRLSGVNSTDGIWNLALTNELKNQFPPEHPGFAGLPLRGYHLLANLSLAQLEIIFNLDPIHSYFHFFPLLIAFFWAGGLYVLVEELSGQKLAALLAVFFSIFGGSFVFLFPGFKEKGLNFDDGFGLQQPVSALWNPSFSVSIVVIIIAAFFFNRYLTQARVKYLLLFSLSVGIAVGFKVYAGLILLGGLFVVSIFRLLSQKIDLAISFVIALALTGFLFLPLNLGSGSFVLFPFWPIRQLMEGNFSFTNWELTRRLYSSQSNIFGLAKLYFEAGAIFIIGNLGTRILAFFWLFNRKLRNGLPSPFYLFFFSCLAVSLFLPMFFIQSGGGVFNMIQMFWYFLFLMATLTGIYLGSVLGKVKPTYRIILLLVTFFLTVPSAAYRLIQPSFNQPSFVSNNSLTPLDYLRKNYRDGQLVVMEIPDLPSWDYALLANWYWESRPLVSAFGQKRAFIQNEVAIFSYPDKERRLKVIESFMKEKTLEPLAGEKIDFLITPTRISWISKLAEVKLVFENQDLSLYSL